MTPANTVVNAFHIRALELMAELGRVLGRTAEADDYAARSQIARVAFQKEFFEPASGLCRDGIGTDHLSSHATLFPLALGLIPSERRAAASWLGRRGMKCSVYAAQYRLEALFQNGAAEVAIQLMTAPGFKFENNAQVRRRGADGKARTQFSLLFKEVVENTNIKKPEPCKYRIHPLANSPGNI